MTEVPSVVVAACLLADGSQVYLRSNETWTCDVQQAALFSWSEGELHLSRRAEDGLPLVFATSVVEAERCGGEITLIGQTCGVT